VGEKQLANRSMRGKRIQIINTNSVTKKKKTIQAETAGGGPPEAGGSPAEMKIKKTPAVRRTSTAKKSSTAGKKSATAGKTKVSMPPEAAQGGDASDEAIRLRAYFISERRRRFGLPGDADSDWLEAKRQLLFETGRR
jgi:hypothetical protein